MVRWLIGDKYIPLAIINLNILAFFQLDQIDHPKTDAINKFILHLPFQKKFVSIGLKTKKIFVFIELLPRLLARVKAVILFTASAVYLVHSSRCFTSVQIYQAANSLIHPQMALYLLILKCLLCSY